MINICIPMAGEGKRFKEFGYKEPKPFIPINGKPMIEWVIRNLKPINEEVKFTFIVQKEHLQEYNFELLVRGIGLLDFDVVMLDHMTGGAAETVLTAKEYIDNDDPLLIANSDQLMLWDSDMFIQTIKATGADGAIPTFSCNASNCSYVKMNYIGYADCTKEKEVISENATIGLYYFNKGSDYVYAAEDMINKNIRTNGESYVCPVYNQLIYPKGYKVIIYPLSAQAVYQIGTPELLQDFRNELKENEHLQEYFFGEKLK